MALAEARFAEFKRAASFRFDHHLSPKLVVTFTKAHHLFLSF